MKPSKNEADIVGLMNTIQSKLIAIEMKVDTLMQRSGSQVKPFSKSVGLPVKTTNDHNKGRHMYTAICADCKKECNIPFKPTGDRPVYCQDCFSRRRVMNLSGMNVADKPKDPVPVQAPIETQKTASKEKKKAVTVKKTVAKKKVAAKKK